MKASKLILVGRENGFDKICAFVLKADITTQIIGNIDTMTVKIITIYINIFVPIFLILSIVTSPFLINAFIHSKGFIDHCQNNKA